MCFEESKEKERLRLPADIRTVPVGPCLIVGDWALLALFFSLCGYVIRGYGIAILAMLYRVFDRERILRTHHFSGNACRQSFRKNMETGQNCAV